MLDQRRGICQKCEIVYVDDRFQDAGNTIVRGGLRAESLEEFRERCDHRHIAGDECFYWLQPELMESSK